MVVAVGIFILYGIQEKSQRQVWSICKKITISGFAAAILDSWTALDLIGLHDFVAQPYLGKVTKAFHSTPNGSETTAKTPACMGVKLLPSPYKGYIYSYVWSIIIATIQVKVWHSSCKTINSKKKLLHLTPTFKWRLLLNMASVGNLIYANAMTSRCLLIIV